MSMIVLVWMSDCTLHFSATGVGLIVLRIGLRLAHNLEKAPATVPLNGYDNSHTFS